MYPIKHTVQRQCCRHVTYFFSLINRKAIRLNYLLGIVHENLKEVPVLRIEFVWALGLLDPDPDPLVRGTDPDSGSFYHQAKIVRNPWIPTFCDFFMTVYLWKLYKYTFKKYPAENGSGSIGQRHGSADPDPAPYQNVTDPQHWKVKIYYSLEPQLQTVWSLIPGSRLSSISSSSSAKLSSISTFEPSENLNKENTSWNLTFRPIYKQKTSSVQINNDTEINYKKIDSSGNTQIYYKIYASLL